MSVQHDITGKLPDDFINARCEFSNHSRLFATDFRVSDSLVEDILAVTVGPAWIATTRANWTVLRDAIDELLTAEVTA